jgi:hypothetical protein
MMIATRLLLAAVITSLAAAAPAQDSASADRVMNAVRAAMAPALPFPASDELGSLPADGKWNGPWMVKPLQPGERIIEVLANPLNPEHQKRAAQAMAQIEASIEAAQRRADLQYERAIAEAKRTGRSQDVDGVTLNDEGLAGAKIDAESHVSIEVVFNAPPSKAVAIDRAPPGVYRGDDGMERFREAQATVSAGTLVITLRGNEALIADLLTKSDWNSLLELLK